MPTLLNRERLLAAIEKVIEADKAVWEKSWQRYNDAVKAREEEWLNDYLDLWNETANAIKRAVKRREPITSGMLPKSQGNTAVFDPHRLVLIDGKHVGTPTEQFRPSPELISLKHVLTAINDENVTPNALDALGITKAALRDAVQAMGRQETS